MAVEFLSNDWPDLLALVWFLICFKGYAYFAQYRALTTPCLANVLHLYRTDWMRQMLGREVRIADISAVGNLERAVAFFASSTMLILAGLVTAIGASERLIGVVSELPLLSGSSKTEWEVKFLVLIVLFIYAFFKFTWSLRQYGFCAVLIGSAPQYGEEVTENEVKAFISRSSKTLSRAANNFNFGLRSYYFSLAVLAWFINAWCFIAFSTVVVIVLYLREFRSPVLLEMTVSTPDDNSQAMDFRNELHK